MVGLGEMSRGFKFYQGTNDVERQEEGSIGRTRGANPMNEQGKNEINSRLGRAFSLGGIAQISPGEEIGAAENKVSL